MDSAMPQDTKRSSRREEKRARIINAATRVFSERGYNAATMAQVARAADVGKGTLYEYFPSKEELYFNVFEHFIATVYAAATFPPGDGKSEYSAAQCLTEMNRAIVEQLEKSRDQYGLSLEFWSASASSALRERFRETFRSCYRMYGSVVEQVVIRGVANGEFRATVDSKALAMAMVGAWDAMGLQAWFDENFPMQRTAKAYMDVILAGLAA